MSKYISSALKIIYSFVEQFVFYVALIVGFLVWATFGNIYVSALVFLLVCILFWALPSMLKRKK